MGPELVWTLEKRKATALAWNSTLAVQPVTILTELSLFVIKI
jgi:hypothetical protein